MIEEDEILLDDGVQERKQHKKVRLVHAWGKNEDGELGLTGSSAPLPTPSRGFKGYAREIATARSHSVILNADGQIYLSGSLLFGKIGIPAQVTNFRQFRLHQQMSQYTVTKVACGDYHTLALLEDGTVFSWGGTLWDKTGHKGGGINRMQKLVGQQIVDIACGDFHSVALNSVGQVYSWGGGGQNKNKGQLGHSNKKDLPHPQKIKFFQDKKVMKIACGDYHTMVMVAEGDLYAFGEGNMGQLGNGGKEDSSTPKKVKLNFSLALEEFFRSDITEPTRIEQISLGGHHSLLLTNKGHLYACGYGSQGQLGLGQGQTDNKYQPTLVKPLLGKQVIMIAAGANHSIALTSRHDVYSCGYNSKGQLGLGEEKTVTIWTHIIELSQKKVGRIFAGGDHSWAVIDERAPIIEDYEPPSPIKLHIDEPTIMKRDENSQQDKSGFSGNSFNDLLAEMSSNRKLELIISEVQMSHRFIHFSVKQSCKPHLMKKKIDEYLKFANENERNTMKYTKVTEDGEIFDAKGKQILNANPRGYTIMLVCEVPTTANQYIYSNPSKTSISIGEMFMMEADMLKVEKKIPTHNRWFFKFNELFEDILEKARFVELRPKLL